jgi:hypothetical protein
MEMEGGDGGFYFIRVHHGSFIERIGEIGDDEDRNNAGG